MIFEIAEIEVHAGQEEQFESAVAQASPLFRQARGCRSMKLERGIEHPSRYRLVVGWNSVDDHMLTFRNSESFQRWRELAGPFFASPPKVEHVSCVLDAFS